MKSIKHITILLITLLALAGCRKGMPKQDLRHEEIKELNARVLEKAIGEPDSALMMIDSLRVSGMLPDYRCDFLRAKIYAQTLEGSCLDSAIIIGERLMTLDEVNEDLALKQDVLEVLVQACRQHRDDELTIHWCAQLIDLCRENGDETEALRNEAEIGLMLAGIGNVEEGLAKIDSVINQLGGQRKFNEMDASIIALRRKITVLNNCGRFNEIPEVGQTIIDLLADFEQNPDVFHDGTYREPPEHLRAGYIDFYRSQDYSNMANAFAKMSLGLSVESLEFDEARRKAKAYLDLFLQSDLAQTYTGRKHIAGTYCLLGEYDKMEAIRAEEEALLRAQGDTVSAEYATILHDRAIAAEAQGRKDDALRLRKDYEALTEILNNNLLQGKAHLYAARFHAQEQQREIERHREATRRARMIGFGIGVVGLLVFLFALYAFGQWRKTQRRNRILAQQITEAVKYKEKYKELATHNAQLSTQNSQLSTDSKLSTLNPQLSTLSDAALFDYLRDLIEREQLFLDPNFERQTLINRTGLSKERIGAAFAQASDYKRLSTLVRELRLDYAVRLMNEQPELSVEDIFRSSGFLRADTFATSFRAKYGMTPTAYRQANAL